VYTFCSVREVHRGGSSGAFFCCCVCQLLCFASVCFVCACVCVCVRVCTCSTSQWQVLHSLCFASFSERLQEVESSMVHAGQVCTIKCTSHPSPSTMIVLETCKSVQARGLTNTATSNEAPGPAGLHEDCSAAREGRAARERRALQLVRRMQLVKGVPYMLAKGVPCMLRKSV
jgi:hypothetical protein